MNIRNLSLASLAGAVLTTLLANVPLINLVNCLLCIGFWGGAVLAVWVYKRLSASLTLGQGVAIGTVTGLVAGLLGFALSFAGLAGAAGLANTARPFVDAATFAEMQKALAGAEGMAFTLAGVVITIVFGAIGGLIGGALFRSRPQAA